MEHSRIMIFITVVGFIFLNQAGTASAYSGGIVLIFLVPFYMLGGLVCYFIGKHLAKKNKPLFERNTLIKVIVLLSLLSVPFFVQGMVVLIIIGLINLFVGLSSTGKKSVSGIALFSIALLPYIITTAPFYVIWAIS